MTYVTRFPPFGGDISMRPRYAMPLPVSGFRHRYEARLDSTALNQRVPVIRDVGGGGRDLIALEGRAAQRSVAANGAAVYAFVGSEETYVRYPAANNPLPGPIKTVMFYALATLRDQQTPIVWGDLGSPYSLDAYRTADNRWRAISQPSWSRQTAADTSSTWDVVAVVLDGNSSRMYVNGTEITGTGAGQNAVNFIGLGGRGSTWGRFQLAALALHPEALSKEQIVAVEASWRQDYGL